MTIANIFGDPRSGIGHTVRGVVSVLSHPAIIALVLVALDARVGHRFPVAGLIGFAGAFTLLDRFADYTSPAATNLLYIAGTLAAAAVLIDRLRSASQRGLDRLASDRERLGQLAGVATAGPG